MKHVLAVIMVCILSFNTGCAVVVSNGNKVTMPMTCEDTK